MTKIVEDCGCEFDDSQGYIEQLICIMHTRRQMQSFVDRHDQPALNPRRPAPTSGYRKMRRKHGYLAWPPRGKQRMVPIRVQEERCR